MAACLRCKLNMLHCSRGYPICKQCQLGSAFCTYEGEDNVQDGGAILQESKTSGPFPSTYLQGIMIRSNQTCETGNAPSSSRTIPYFHFYNHLPYRSKVGEPEVTEGCLTTYEFMLEESGTLIESSLFEKESPSTTPTRQYIFNASSPYETKQKLRILHEMLLGLPLGASKTKRVFMPFCNTQYIREYSEDLDNVSWKPCMLTVKVLGINDLILDGDFHEARAALTSKARELLNAKTPGDIENNPPLFSTSYFSKGREQPFTLPRDIQFQIPLPSVSQVNLDPSPNPEPSDPKPPFPQHSLGRPDPGTAVLVACSGIHPELARQIATGDWHPIEEGDMGMDRGVEDREGEDSEGDREGEDSEGDREGEDIEENEKPVAWIWVNERL